MTFTDAAHNAVLVGGPGTDKTHLATAIGVADRLPDSRASAPALSRQWVTCATAQRG